jgi:hypothetical protein
VIAELVSRRNEYEGARRAALAAWDDARANPDDRGKLLRSELENALAAEAFERWRWWQTEIADWLAGWLRGMPPARRTSLLLAAAKYPDLFAGLVPLLKD